MPLLRSSLSLFTILLKLEQHRKKNNPKNRQSILIADSEVL